MTNFTIPAETVKPVNKNLEMQVVQESFTVDKYAYWVCNAKGDLVSSLSGVFYKRGNSIIVISQSPVVTNLGIVSYVAMIISNCNTDYLSNYPAGTIRQDNKIVSVNGNFVLQYLLLQNKQIANLYQITSNGNPVWLAKHSKGIHYYKEGIEEYWP